VDSGALSQVEARRSPLSGVLASALGGSEASPQTRTVEIRWGDVMLLCTDGLTRHVTDAEIEGELRQIQSSEESCRKLVKLALERGGTDNVTVVISRLKPRPS
jgi:protein phosphatase